MFATAAMSIKLHSNHDPVDDSLLSMINHCHSLRVLYVRSGLRVSTIDRICTLQAENKISMTVLTSENKKEIRKTLINVALNNFSYLRLNITRGSYSCHSKDYPFKVFKL